MNDGKEVEINNASQYPETNSKIRTVMEPLVQGTIITPAEYAQLLVRLCEERRGEQQEFTYIDKSRVLLRYKLPLSEVISGFFERIKGISSGFATFDYETAGYEETGLAKVEIHLNGNPVDALASLVHNSRAEQHGKETVSKLKDLIERHLFVIAIQAVVHGKVIARET
jgi:translation elongation factor EF-4